jgi:hypothetical protein
MGNYCIKDQRTEFLLNSSHMRLSMVQSIHKQPYDTLDFVDRIGEGSTCRINKVELKDTCHKTTTSKKCTTLQSKESNEEKSIKCKRSRYFAMKELVDLETVNDFHLNELENEIRLLRALVCCILSYNILCRNFISIQLS